MFTVGVRVGVTVWIASGRGVTVGMKSGTAVGAPCARSVGEIGARKAIQAAASAAPIRKTYPKRFISSLMTTTYNWQWSVAHKRD
jgi:hypothetical protein